LLFQNGEFFMKTRHSLSQIFIGAVIGLSSAAAQAATPADMFNAQAAPAISAADPAPAKPLPAPEQPRPREFAIVPEPVTADSIRRRDGKKPKFEPIEPPHPSRARLHAEMRAQQRTQAQLHRHAHGSMRGHRRHGG
jgi:hypothetical protein